MRSPIVFIIFNRPDVTRQVFESIRAARPRQLFIVADGPRTEAESSLCNQTREVVELIDWDCVVERNYSATNLGCKHRVSSGLDWVFRQVEEAIILEDDCLPDASFFPFVEQMLEKYRHENRVMHIGGHNFQHGRRLSSNSYYFSHNVHVWGWATWSRAWAYYDVAMKSWPESKPLLQSTMDNPVERSFWTTVWDDSFSGLIDTWDYQWVFACRAQGALSIIPETNLVSNIGFGPSATHTLDTEHRFANLPTTAMRDPLIHPKLLLRNCIADSAYVAESIPTQTRVRNAALTFLMRAFRYIFRLIKKKNQRTLSH